MTQSISILGTAPQLRRVEVSAKAPAAVQKGQVCKLTKTTTEGDGWTAEALVGTDHSNPHVVFAMATKAAAANEQITWVVQGIADVQFRDVAGNLAAADTACSVVGSTGVQNLSAASAGERIVAYNKAALTSGATVTQVTWFDGLSMVFA